MELEKMVYEKYIAPIVKVIDGERYVLSGDLEQYKLNMNEYAFIKGLLKKYGINEYIKTPNERSTRVSDLNYGNIESIGLSQNDRDRFNSIQYDEDGEIISEDYSELEKYLDEQFVPTHIRTIKDYHESGPFKAVQLGELLSLKLSDFELAHAVEYLQSKDIVVRGKNSSFDEFENFQYLNTYHNLGELPPALVGDEFENIFREYLEKKKIFDNLVSSNAPEQTIKAAEDDMYEVRNKLVEGNMRLVAYVASRTYMRFRTIEFEELLSIGNEKLMHIIDNYDINRGNAFSTYAYVCLVNSMLNGMKIYGTRNNVPISRQSQVYKLRKARDELFIKLQREPTNIELAAALSLKPSVIDQILMAESVMFELDNYSSVDEIFSDDNVIDAANSAMLREHFNVLLKTLTPREAKIIRMRYGFDDGKIYTQKEVGKILGLSANSISRIELKALRKLRHPSRSKRLRDFQYDWSDSPYTDGKVFERNKYEDDGSYGSGPTDGNIPDYFSEDYIPDKRSR